MKKIKKILLTTVLLVTVFAQNLTGVEAEERNIKLGIDGLLAEHKETLKGKRVGLITNPTGVDANLTHIVDLLHEDKDINLVALYGPEHGVRGDAQAGSTITSYVDKKTGVTVHSLYGSTKKPTAEMLEGVDVLIFDIQDVGARFYTYISTMAYAMEAAQENGIEIVVLDRPNPLGGNLVDGPILEEAFSSFVGLYPIPVVHGMTVGELAYYFNDVFEINADLTVIPMKNWSRDMLFDDTRLHLVLPSPNMPTTDSVVVYPGSGFFEGTNLSEGRGTTKPFELIGAPYIDGYDYAKALNELNLPGVKFRSASFTPQFSKHKGTLSHGVQIHVTDQRTYDPIRTGLEMIIKLQEMYPNDFIFTPNWNNTSYFFNTLIGNSWVREDILAGKTYQEIEAKWSSQLNEFKENRKPYLIYDVDLNFKTLDEKIAEAENLNKDDFTNDSFEALEASLKQIINSKSKLLNNFEIDQMITLITEKIDALVKVNDSDKNIINQKLVKELKDAIDKAHKVDHAHYTASSLENLTNTLKKAENLYHSLLENNYHEDASIQEMIVELKEALDGLKELDLDKDKLEEVINEVMATDKEIYTEDSVAKLEEALANAKDVFENAKTQEDIDKAYEILQNALNNLIVKDGILPSTGLSYSPIIPISGLLVLGTGYILNKKEEE